MPRAVTPEHATSTETGFAWSFGRYPYRKVMPEDGTRAIVLGDYAVDLVQSMNGNFLSRAHDGTSALPRLYMPKPPPVQRAIWGQTLRAAARMKDRQICASETTPVTRQGSGGTLCEVS